MFSKLFSTAARSMSTAMRKIVSQPKKGASLCTHPALLYVRAQAGAKTTSGERMSAYKALSAAQQKKYIAIANANRKIVDQRKAVVKGLKASAYTVFTKKNFTKGITGIKAAQAVMKKLAKKWNSISPAEKKRYANDAAKIRAECQRKFKMMTK